MIKLKTVRQLCSEAAESAQRGRGDRAPRGPGCRSAFGILTHVLASRLMRTNEAKQNDTHTQRRGDISTSPDRGSCWKRNRRESHMSTCSSQSQETLTMKARRSDHVLNLRFNCRRKQNTSYVEYAVRVEGIPYNWQKYCRTRQKTSISLCVKLTY